MGLLLEDEAKHVRRVTGDYRGVTRIGESFPDIVQGLEIIVHCQHPDLIPHRPPGPARPRRHGGAHPLSDGQRER